LERERKDIIEIEMLKGEGGSFLNFELKIK
jgi:hypothetical protein